MSRLEYLTPDQIARFPEFVERWTKIGLCTDPADRPRAEAALRWMYQHAKLTEPKIVWCGSPLTATGHAHRIADKGAELYEHGGKLYLQVEEAVTVTHEEHHAQTWEPGVYEIDRVREKDMLEGFTRRVID